MSYKFPVYKPRFSGRERELVLDCIDSTWISSKGKYIAEFESAFAARVGVKHAIAVSNGTVALHLALEALGVGDGDEVIVPTLTYIASANAVRYCGADVVFADSEPELWQIDVEDVARRITPRTKAIMPVHLYGQACDMAALMELAKKHGLAVVEDCAEALGTRVGDRCVGGFGDISTFSFFGNKTITTGEGGMVVTNDGALAKLAMRLRGQGLAEGREYWHDVLGFNYRMTNICAAIGCAQLEILDDNLRRKRQIAEWYRQALEGSPVRVHAEGEGSTHSYWMVSVLIDAPLRDGLRAHLRAAGIETRPLFFPVHQMDMYRRAGEVFPVAEGLSGRGLNLPSYPELTEADVGEIAGAVKAYCMRNTG